MSGCELVQAKAVGHVTSTDDEMSVWWDLANVMSGSLNDPKRPQFVAPFI